MREAGRRGGQRSTLTDELCAAICALIEETACSLYTAGLSLGISWSTLYFWERWGREGKEPYQRFTQAVMEARARAELTHVREFKEADRDRQRSTQYYPFILERRFANDYGNRIKIEEAVGELSDAELEAQLAATRSRVSLDPGGRGAETPALPAADESDAE